MVISDKNADKDEKNNIACFFMVLEDSPEELWTKLKDIKSMKLKAVCL